MVLLAVRLEQGITRPLGGSQIIVGISMKVSLASLVVDAGLLKGANIVTHLLMRFMHSLNWPKRVIAMLVAGPHKIMKLSKC